MPTDLEQRIARFAEALDREAPTISFDELVGRGTVAVDVDPLERPSSDRASRVDGVSWIDTTPGHDEFAERDVLIEFTPAVAARRPARRRVALKVAVGAAAAAVLIVAVAAIERGGDGSAPADGPPSTVPTTVPTTTQTPTSGGMWPQSSLDEVRVAQERADAGDPDYTRQVAPQLALYEETTAEPGQVELVDRFLREVLGWEEYLFDPHQGGGPDGRTGEVLRDQRFHRCAPGRTNPLYPPGYESERGELCAPTLDDLRYETVSVDLAQLDRQGRDGIWVVNRWRLTAPFAQADPAAVEARLTERLEEFLAARIAGAGAEGHVQVEPGEDVPLLYATTAKAPYERFEIERVAGPRWPYAFMTFSARLFADGGATVVEQEISGAQHGADEGGGVWLRLDSTTTTENGQPVVVSYTSSDGEVTVSAPSTWSTWSGGGANHGLAPGVWFWEFERGEDRIELTDPVAYDAWCATHGGSPLLSASAGAEVIAQALIADPNFETTAPVSAPVGGVDAVSIDVTLAPGGRACGVGMIVISRWIHVGARVAPASLPRRSPAGYVSPDASDHGRGARGALRGGHRGDRTDHRVHPVPPRLMGDS